jgi:hypothetical protein
MNFSLCHCIHIGLEPTQPPIQWLLGGGGAHSPGVKQPGHEADDSSPSIAKVKSAWSYTSTLPYTFMAWCLIKPGTTLLYYYIFE